MWPLTFYVKTLPPDVGGTANGPVIRILEKYRDDKGIYWHEFEHVKQWLFCTAVTAAVLAILQHLLQNIPLAVIILSTSVHSLFYLLIPQYRLWAEVSAYKEQLKHYSDDRSALFASYISKYYRLNISEAEALEKLK